MAKSKLIVVGGGLAGLMATIKAAEEGTPAADAAVHQDVLEELQLGPVVLVVLRAVLDFRLDRLDVPPAVVRRGNLIRPIVPQHLPAPGWDILLSQYHSACKQCFLLGRLLEPGQVRRLPVERVYSAPRPCSQPGYRRQMQTQP